MDWDLFNNVVVVSPKCYQSLICYAERPLPFLSPIATLPFPPLPLFLPFPNPPLLRLKVLFIAPD